MVGTAAVVVGTAVESVVKVPVADKQAVPAEVVVPVWYQACLPTNYYSLSSSMNSMYCSDVTTFAESTRPRSTAIEKVPIKLEKETAL